MVTIRMKKGEIIFYTRVNCSACVKAKKYFEDNSIQYTEKDVVVNPEYRKEQLDIGYKTLPLTLYNGNIIAGFDESKFDKIFLQLKKSK